MPLRLPPCCGCMRTLAPGCRGFRQTQYAPAFSPCVVPARRGPRVHLIDSIPSWCGALLACNAPRRVHAERGLAARNEATHAGCWVCAREAALPECACSPEANSQLPAEIEALLSLRLSQDGADVEGPARCTAGRGCHRRAEKNVIPILSFINTEENIRENWQVCMLQETLQPERAPKPKPGPEPNVKPNPKPNPNWQVLLEKFDREEASAWPPLQLS